MKSEIEYKEALSKLEADFELAKKNLNIEYGLSSAKYKVGDIINDHAKSILIDRVTVHMSFSRLPEPVYHGVELNKNLTPNKKGNRGAVYGHHLVKLIKIG